MGEHIEHIDAVLRVNFLAQIRVFVMLWKLYHFNQCKKCRNRNWWLVRKKTKDENYLFDRTLFKDKLKNLRDGYSEIKMKIHTWIGRMFTP